VKKNAEPFGRVMLPNINDYNLNPNYFTLEQNLVNFARFDHVPNSEKEIELRVGDPLSMGSNQWNGMSNGTNQRTNKVTPVVLLF